MAENKKSILVYADWINKFDELSDDEAGRLIKHFFRYVNDLDPVAPDRITKLMFVDIQNTLKRDLNKYKSVKDDRSNSGKLGNLKRYNKDLYDKVVSKEITLEEALGVANTRKDSQDVAKESLANKKVAKLAVSDSDSVSVSVNDSNNSTVPLDKPKTIDFDTLLKFINEKTGKNFKPINKTNIAKYKARLKDGYTKEDVKNTIINACEETYHKENNFKYLTPEFFSRANTIDKYGFKSTKTKGINGDWRNPYDNQ